MRRSSLLLLAAGSLVGAQKCSLTVTIVSGDIACSADNGCSGDPRRFLDGSKPDGYVTAKLGPTTFATPTVNDDESPEWQAELDFECPYDVNGVNAATHLVLTMMDSDGDLRGDDEQMLQCDLGTVWRDADNNGKVQQCQNDKNSLTYSINYEYEEVAPTPAPAAPTPAPVDNAPTPAPAAEPTPKPVAKTTPTPTSKSNPKTTNAPVMVPTPAPTVTAPTSSSDDDATVGLPTGDAVMAQLNFGQPNCVASGVEVLATGESLTATGVTGYVDAQGGCSAELNALLGAKCSSITAYEWSFSLPPTSGGTGKTTYSVSSVDDCGIASSGRRLGSSHGRALATPATDRFSMSWKEGAVLCNDGSSFVALVKDSDNDGVYGMTFATSDSTGFESATKGIPKVTGGYCSGDMYSVMDTILSHGPDTVIEDNGIKYTSETSDSGSSSGISFTSGENLVIIVGSVLGAALLTSCVVYKVRSNKKKRAAAAAAAANADARGFYGANGSGKTVIPVNAAPAPLHAAPVASAPAAAARPPSYRANAHQGVEEEYLSSADPSPEPSPAPYSGVKSAAAPVAVISAAVGATAAAVGVTAAARQHDYESASEESEEEEEQEAAAGAESSYSYSNSYDQHTAAAVAVPAAALTPATIAAGSQPRGTPARPSSGRGSPSNFASTGGTSVGGSYHGQRGNNSGYPVLELGSSNGGRPYDSNVSDGFWGNDEPLSPYVPGTLTPTNGGHSAESSPQPRRKRASAMDRLRAFP